MSYRDEREALSEKARALEARLDEAEGELARAKEQAAKAEALEKRVRELEEANRKGRADERPQSRRPHRPRKDRKERGPIGKQVALGVVALVVVGVPLAASECIDSQSTAPGSDPAPMPGPLPADTNAQAVPPAPPGPRFDPVERTALVVTASESSPVAAGERCTLRVTDGDGRGACVVRIGCSGDPYGGELGASCIVGAGGLEHVRDVWISQQIGPFIEVTTTLPITVDFVARSATLGDDRNDRPRWNAVLRLDP